MRRDWWRFWVAKVDGPEYVMGSVSVTVVAGVKCYTIGYRLKGWESVNIALCKCGVDMSKHPDIDFYELVPIDMQGFDHMFDAAGTRHRCGKEVQVEEGVWLCPRPAYHDEEGVECGPLTGREALVVL